MMDRRTGHLARPADPTATSGAALGTHALTLRIILAPFRSWRVEQPRRADQTFDVVPLAAGEYLVAVAASAPTPIACRDPIVRLHALTLLMVLRRFQT